MFALLERATSGEDLSWALEAYAKCEAAMPQSPLPPPGDQERAAAMAAKEALEHDKRLQDAARKARAQNGGTLRREDYRDLLAVRGRLGLPPVKESEALRTLRDFSARLLGDFVKEDQLKEAQEIEMFLEGYE